MCFLILLAMRFLYIKGTRVQLVVSILMQALSKFTSDNLFCCIFDVPWKDCFSCLTADSMVLSGSLMYKSLLANHDTFMINKLSLFTLRLIIKMYESLFCLCITTFNLCRFKYKYILLRCVNYYITEIRILTTQELHKINSKPQIYYILTAMKI